MKRIVIKLLRCKKCLAVLVEKRTEKKEKEIWYCEECAEKEGGK